MTEVNYTGIPKNTEFHGWNEFSAWDGKLALISCSSTNFDPEAQTRQFIVRYAVDLNTKQPLCATDYERFVGFRPHIANGSIPYEETTFNINRLHGSALVGGFAPAEIAIVQIQLKDLLPAETRAVEQLLIKKGYVDITDIKYKAKKSEWKQMLGMTFAEIQDKLHYELANAADALVTQILKRYADTEDEERSTWEGIKGVYKTTKNGDHILYFESTD